MVTSHLYPIITYCMFRVVSTSFSMIELSNGLIIGFAMTHLMSKTESFGQQSVLHRWVMA